MVKAELGTKRLCPGCRERYYDLMKDPAVCPHCEAVYDPEAAFRPRRARAAVKTDKADAGDEEADDAVVAGADVEDADAVTTADDDLIDSELEEDSTEGGEGSAVLEDASELGDDDSVEEVLENRDESSEEET